MEPDLLVMMLMRMTKELFHLQEVCLWPLSLVMMMLLLLLGYLFYSYFSTRMPFFQAGQRKERPNETRVENSLSHFEKKKWNDKDRGGTEVVSGVSNGDARKGKGQNGSLQRRPGAGGLVKAMYDVSSSKVKKGGKRKM